MFWYACHVWQFKEQEKKRAASLEKRQEQKHSRQKDEQQQKNTSAVKELETMQVGLWIYDDGFLSICLSVCLSVCHNICSDQAMGFLVGCLKQQLN